VLVGAPAAAPPSVSASCSPGPSDCGAWHTSDVTVTWTVSGAPNTCPSVTISFDTGGSAVSCSATNADGSVTASVNVRRDASGPAIEASASRGPDSDGWYRSPVSFTGSGSDGLSGLAGCSNASYSGPDTGSASVSVTCRDNAGNESSRSFDLRYDATPPEVTGAAADRNPDSGEWYTRPLTVAFNGSDATSGLAGCTSAPYSGPDGEQVTVSGTCRDKAGNTSAPRAFTFRYDATPPEIKTTEVKKGNGFVTLSWSAAGGVASSEVTRAAGKEQPAVVYKGTAGTFTDRGVKNGVKYQYTIAVADAAGNADRETVSALPRPPLYQPVRGARVRAPATFAWEKVPKATYYNFQLYRRVGARWVKVMTTWPGRPWLRVQRQWNVGGFRDRLTPGRYRWYVFPGFQKRIQRRYGKLLGSSEFVVRR
jgi:hypothetical protein